ncbi:MAG: hypothetical protein ACJAX4_000211 [Clostridium sp.]|jgi:hypothetical protein
MKCWGRLTIIALNRNTFKKEKLNVSNILIIDDEEKVSEKIKFNLVTLDLMLPSKERVMNLAVFKLCKA